MERESTVYGGFCCSPASTAGAGVKSTTFANIKYTRRLGELCEWIVKTDVKN
jgi:hypothetical protein